jgi:hypothetical protein
VIGNGKPCLHRSPGEAVGDAAMRGRSHPLQGQAAVAAGIAG